MRGRGNDDDDDCDQGMSDGREGHKKEQQAIRRLSRLCEGVLGKKNCFCFISCILFIRSGPVEWCSAAVVSR